MTKMFCTRNPHRAPSTGERGHEDPLSQQFGFQCRELVSQNVLNFQKPLPSEKKNVLEEGLSISLGIFGKKTVESGKGMRGEKWA